MAFTPIPRGAGWTAPRTPRDPAPPLDSPAGTHTARGLTRRHALLAEPAAALPGYPGPGESLHFLLDRRWDMGKVIASAARRGPRVTHLRVATLSVGAPQLDALTGLLDDGTVARASLVVSDYFARMEKSAYQRCRDEFAGRGHPVAAPRCHAKVVTLAFADGTCLAIEGSANLRANKCFEQIAVANDRGLHDFHASWIDEVIRQYDQAQDHQGDAGPEG
jgi:hypothetical protein